MNPDQMFLRELRVRCGAELCRILHPELDKLVDQQSMEPDPVKRNR